MKTLPIFFLFFFSFNHLINGIEDDEWISRRIEEINDRLNKYGEKSLQSFQKESNSKLMEITGSNIKSNKLLIGLNCNRWKNSEFLICSSSSLNTQESFLDCNSDGECLSDDRKDALEISMGKSRFDKIESTSKQTSKSILNFIMEKLPKSEGKSGIVKRIISIESRENRYFPQLVGISPVFGHFIGVYLDKKHSTKVVEVKMDVKYENEEKSFEFHVQMDHQESIGSFHMISNLWHHIGDHKAFFSKRQSINETLKMMTYNLWNYGGYNWTLRHEEIARIIVKENPDLVAFQEIRETKDKGNQLDFLFDHVKNLNGTNYLYTYLKAAKQPKSQEEGIGMFIKPGFRVIARRMSKLTHDDCGDANTRSLLSLSLDTGISQFDFSGTHWSYDPECEMGNARETYQFFVRQLERPVFLLGDLNIYRGGEKPLFYLTRPQAGHPPQTRFVDLYTKFDSPNSNKTFPTSGNLPDVRCDIIMGREGVMYGIEAKSYKVVGDQPFYKDVNTPIFPSDHMGVVGEWKLFPKPL